MKHPLRFLLIAFVLIANVAHADWVADGSPISVEVDLQMNPAIISDGGTGAIIAWQDRRDGGFNIFVQRLDAAGNALWTAGGVEVCAEANDQSDPRLISDGAGGAIIAWEDARTSTNFDIYAQRVDASGAPQWTVGGVALCTADFNQHNPAIVSDGAGGAIVVWQDHRAGQPDIYAQLVDDAGDPMWDVDGVAVCAASRAQQVPIAVSDDAGGAVVCWVDRRTDLGDIYVQRVDASGAALWTANGVALCAAAEAQTVPVIVGDDLGGAFVAWADLRGGVSDIYASHVDNLGAPLSTVNGVAVCTATGGQSDPAIALTAFAVSGAHALAAGAATIAWEDARSGNSDIYASAFLADGTQPWGIDGVAMCTAPLAQSKVTVTRDGLAGAIVAWQDQRPNFHTDVYAQRVDPNGGPQWDVNGVKLCGAAGSQYDPVIVFSDAATAIVSWEDVRSGEYDIYAQFVTGSPAAVAITSFEATWNGDGVALRAAFRSDLRIVGVNVYRGRALGTLQPIDDLVRAGASGFEYLDRDAIPGETYRYQIGVVDADGEFRSPIVTVSSAALVAALDQNRPNPFNPTTMIRFVTPERAHVSLVVYDAAGRRVRTLLDERRDIGTHEVHWDGRDDLGAAQSSGVYFYRLQSGAHVESRKMVLLK